ncbi:MAG: zinc ribbon domain-containing protein [Chlamydiota bacterium]
MPTYEYTCTSCEHAVEAFQKITDEPLVECPQCKQKSLQRGVGGGQATFQFKGKGFYITDSKLSKESASSCCPCGKNKGSCSQ